MNVRQALEEDPLAYSSEGERAWRVCACVFLACVCVSVCLVCVLGGGGGGGGGAGAGGAGAPPPPPPPQHPPTSPPLPRLTLPPPAGVLEAFEACYNSLVKTGDVHVANSKLLDVIRQARRGGAAGGEGGGVQRAQATLRPPTHTPMHTHTNTRRPRPLACTCAAWTSARSRSSTLPPSTPSQPTWAWAPTSACVVGGRVCVRVRACVCGGVRRVHARSAETTCLPRRVVGWALPERCPPLPPHPPQRVARGEAHGVPAV